MSMQILVKPSIEKAFKLDVYAYDTIYYVKCKIEDKQGIPQTDQRLLFDSDELMDRKTLRDYHIFDGYTLSLVVKEEPMAEFDCKSIEQEEIKSTEADAISETEEPEQEEDPKIQELASEIEKFFGSGVNGDETKEIEDNPAKKMIEQAVNDMAKSKSDQEWQPTMDDFTKMVESEEYKAAESFTEQILNDNNLPEHTEIGVKLFESMLKKSGISNPLFFDSSNPSMSEMNDEVNNLSHLMDAPNQGFVLSLNTEEPAAKVQVKLTTMQACINEGIPNRELDDVRKKLAIAHGLEDDWQKIKIISVFEGSLCFKYTVSDLVGKAWERVKSTVAGAIDKLKQQFPQFKSAKVHPLLYRPAFDIKNFDTIGNKAFTGKPSSFAIGPTAALKETYTQPSGWTRYGLKVLGKYGSDTWIHPFSETDMWWKAYHGTRKAQSVAGIHPADAIHNIACVTGFHVSQTGKKLGGTSTSAGAHGAGVYCATAPENAYVATETLDLKSGKKTFQYVIMCAVRPSKTGVKKVNGGKWWVVADKNDIRPYGILVKEN